MLRKFSSAVAVLGIVFSFIFFSGGVWASEYDHKLDIKKMDVFWKIEDDKIHLKLAAKTTGWVAIGFDPEKAMQGANIVIGAVKKGKVRIEDHYGDRKRNHKKDEKLGGQNHILNPKGMEKDGVTTISLCASAMDRPRSSIFCRSSTTNDSNLVWLLACHGS